MTAGNLHILQIILFVFISVVLCPLASSRTIYVNDNATGLNDGTSWENAYIYLQDALADARNSDKPVEIRVAQGTYTPDKGTGQTSGDREATFQLINGVNITGGYAGAADPNARNFELYETILSGDLQSNDIPLPLDSFFACFTGSIMHLENGCDTFDFDGDTHIDDSDMSVLLNAYNFGENSYHVVTGSDTDPNAVIDGFIITGGNAEPYFPEEPKQYQPEGGGMYNYNGNPVVLNCIFRDNLAGNGGGMYNIGSNPKLFNCTFYKNVARYITKQSGDVNPLYYGLGGAFYDNGSSSILIDCKFIDNTANSGGGMCNGASFPMLTNCIFEGNRALDSGGGIFNRYESKPTLKDCIFINNHSELGAGIRNSQSNPTLTECIFSGNIADRAGGGIVNYSSSPLMIGCKFISNQGFDYGGGIYNEHSSPLMKNCLFTKEIRQEKSVVLHPLVVEVCMLA
jgi:parallel beta-helix repeat protein